MKRILWIAVILQLYILNTSKANEVPVVSNVQVSHENGVAYISYDVSDVDNDQVKISLSISFDYGGRFEIVHNASGDTGLITTGTHKEIQWTMPYYTDFYLKVIADDGEEFDIQSIVNKVSKTKLMEHMNFIVGRRHYEEDGASEHVEEVRQYLMHRFWTDGHDQVHRQPMASYKFGLAWLVVEGANIFARKLGIKQDTLTFLIDGHFDSTPYPADAAFELDLDWDSELETQGADDNASAVAAMLEASRVLAPYHFNKTITFMGFDMEELGLGGSTDFVAEGIQPYETIEGVINLEQIGIYKEEPNSQTLPDNFGSAFPSALNQLAANDFKGDFVLDVANEHSLELRNAFYLAGQTYVPDLKIFSVTAAGYGGADKEENFDIRRSDHAPFWDAHIPAIMVGAGGQYRNKNYHKPADVIDSINFNHMTNVTKASVATLIEMAEIAHVGVGKGLIYTDVKEIEGELGGEFTISPNPAKDYLTLNYENLNVKELNVELIDINGKVVNDTRLTNKEAGQLQLNTSVYPRGEYILLLRGDEKKKSFKLLLQ